MPTEPIQVTIALFEMALLLAGLALLFVLLSKKSREQWLKPNRLPAWPISPFEFVLFLSLMFSTGLILTLIVKTGLGTLISAAEDREGLEIFAYGAAGSGGTIIGWFLFSVLRKRLYTDYGAQPAPLSTQALPLSSAQSLRYGAVTLLVAMPIVTIVSLIWGYILRRIGLPEDPQPLIAIFAGTRSLWVILGMLTVACVLAPVSEELMFRGGVFRFLRQRTGRTVALVVSGLLFGAMHQNWAGFIPLAVFGAILAVAYETTGDIRVPIVAHALFNLNTVMVVLSGLPEIAK
ncbi:lysostaphin resistance A-like protein [Oleiharenicola lentus]|uniref:CPBP family intramembrane glutamic endopeptidase n=1 Tax=Oleiharenicola lentus TaxID=2508720 RepID=UPI003F67C16D